MNRIIEIAAMAVGGLSLFLVCFVGFASLSGKDVSKVAVIGKLFPAPPAEEGHGEAAGEGELEQVAAEHKQGLSDAAVIEASLGVLSAWTLPSPYSTSELRALSEEIKRKHAELEEHEHALARHERAVQEDERELQERLQSLEELRRAAPEQLLPAVRSRASCACTDYPQRAQVAAIVDVQLARLAKRMAEQDLALDLTPAARSALAEEGWDPEYGARPLKRAIQRRLENKLAEAILSQKLLPGDTAIFDFGEDGWKLEPRRTREAVET